MAKKQRITRKEAAELAGVSERTISRWRAEGLLTVERDPEFRRPATYSRAEVLRVVRERQATKGDAEVNKES